jgi:hypothetical protein
LFAIQTSSETISFQYDVPSLDKIKKKIVLIIKARNDKNAPPIDEKNVSEEVIMMEINRQILENLYLVCQVRSFLIECLNLTIGNLSTCPWKSIEPDWRLYRRL